MQLQPAIVELYDNRLLPLASRDYPFSTRLPKDLDGLRLIARVRYHIQSERQHQMLIKKFGLTAKDPYNFTVYEREVPLTKDLAAAFNEDSDPRLGCAVPHPGEGTNEKTPASESPQVHPAQISAAAEP